MEQKEIIVNGESGWVCPVCGRVLSPNITVCPYCGLKNENAGKPNFEDLNTNPFNGMNSLNS